MAYKDGTDPQVGDAVLGTIEGAAARGKVVRYDKKADKLAIERRGDSILHEKSGQMIQGKLEHVEAPAADFELIYRHVAKAPAKPVIAAAGKEA